MHTEEGFAMNKTHFCKPFMHHSDRYPHKRRGDCAWVTKLVRSKEYPDGTEGTSLIYGAVANNHGGKDFRVPRRE